MRDIAIESDEEVEVDPVCGAIVDLDDAEQRDLALEFEGRSYTFCGEGCRSLFEHDPARYSVAGRAQP